MTSYGCQHGLSAYILPAAQCDLKLTSYEMGLLNASFNFGQNYYFDSFREFYKLQLSCTLVAAGTAISCLLFGVIADSMGRRKLLIWTLVVDGCAALLSSLSQNFTVIFFFRFINGIAYV